MRLHSKRLGRVALVAVLASSIVFGASNCASSHAKESSPTPNGTRTQKPGAVADPVYVDGKIGNGWSDWGWAPRDLDAKKHARLDLSNYGGWILQNPNASKTLGGIVVDYRAEESGDFMELRLANDFGDAFPEVVIGPAHRVTASNGTQQVFVPMTTLNPDGLAFDRITLRARRPMKKPWIEIDRIAFTAGDGKAPAKKVVASRTASVEVDCGKEVRPISPYIYSIAYDPRLDAEAKGFYWDIKPAMRRWGGNPTSRYNFKIGHAWNTAEDWFFQNVNFTGDPTYTYKRFLDANATKGVDTALTVPALGWVAKDTSSHSFPVSKYGRQQQVAPENDVAGNGKTPAGKDITPGSPTATSIAAPPSFVAEWVAAIGDKERATKDRLVDLYFIDNEPMLWNSTHRDVHPEPTTYDELLQKAVDYGTAIRKQDPNALIAGPTSWGWPAYFYSARDSAVGFGISPDRISHGNTPLLEWYLTSLKKHREKTGVRILDVLDIHFYPQGEKIYSPAGGGDVDKRRIEAVRSLWDKTYVDGSWITEPIELIPRMKRIIEKSDPGLKLSIGEWSFGGERRMSGGIATAEALGQFGRGGVDYAFYWTYPSKDSPAFNAFKVFRNFDSNGGRFLDLSVGAKAKGGASAFASTDAGKGKMVAVLINPEANAALDTRVDVKGCATSTKVRAYQFSDDNKALHPLDGLTPSALKITLPPLSVTVVELSTP